MAKNDLTLHNPFPEIRDIVNCWNRRVLAADKNYTRYPNLLRLHQEGRRLIFEALGMRIFISDGSDVPSIALGYQEPVTELLGRFCVPGEPDLPQGKGRPPDGSYAYRMMLFIKYRCMRGFAPAEACRRAAIEELDRGDIAASGSYMQRYLSLWGGLRAHEKSIRAFMPTTSNLYVAASKLLPGNSRGLGALIRHIRQSTGMTYRQQLQFFKAVDSATKKTRVAVKRSRKGFLIPPTQMDRTNMLSNDIDGWTCEPVPEVEQALMRESPWRFYAKF